MAGETIIMPIDISTLATTMSMIRNGMNIDEADLERGLQLAGDEGRHQDPQRHVFGVLQLRVLGQLHEQREVGLARLPQHEVACSGRSPRVERLLDVILFSENGW